MESSPLGDDQIQELVDMLLTRKDGGWQSANKGDDSLASWKKRFSEVKEQWEDGMLLIILSSVLVLLLSVAIYPTPLTTIVSVGLLIIYKLL